MIHFGSQTGRLNRSLLFWIALVILGHGVYADTPFVNLEFAFGEAARSLAEPAYRVGLEKYWHWQCNPLGYSAITAWMLKGLPRPADFWVYRLPSLLGNVGILIAGWLFCREIGNRATAIFSLWAALTTLSPLVWIYGGRATADVLAAGLACLALAICFVANGRLLRHLTAGCFFSLAILVKFNAILVGLGFVYLVFAPSEYPSTSKSPSQERPGAPHQKLKSLACYTLLPGAILAAYLAWVYAAYGVLIVAERPQAVFGPSAFATRFPLILAMYGSYLATMLGPLVLVAPARIWQNLSRKKAAAVGVVAAGLAVSLSWSLTNFTAGEMDNGPFQSMLPRVIAALLRIGGLAMAIFLAVDLVGTIRRRRARFDTFLAMTVIPYLIVSSFFRPAQRYLLVCLPLVFLYLLLSTPWNLQRCTRWLRWSSAGIFALISGVAVWYQVAQGQAAENMAVWIAEHGLFAATSPGAIWPHAGQHFPLEDAPSNRFLVQTQPAAPCLHRETVKIFGRIVRTYYLCPKPIPVVTANRTTASATH